VVTTYNPVFDACRVCGAQPPHELRVIGQGIDVLCLECRALLEHFNEAALTAMFADEKAEAQ
jgi:hypothetical protein